MFSTLPETNFNVSVRFILSSASALNLDQSKNLSFGKKLIIKITPTSDIYMYNVTTMRNNTN